MLFVKQLSCTKWWSSSSKLTKMIYYDEDQDILSWSDIQNQLDNTFQEEDVGRSLISRTMSQNLCITCSTRYNEICIYELHIEVTYSKNIHCRILLSLFICFCILIGRANRDISSIKCSNTIFEIRPMPIIIPQNKIYSCKLAFLWS